MDRNDVDWRGYWVAAPTPYAADGALDEETLRQILDLYVSQGVHGIIVNGTSGEWTSQSNAERRRVAEVAIDAVASRIPLVVGCTAYTAHEAIGLVQHAQQAGADGAMATPPPYIHPPAEDIVRYYAEINDATSLPLIAYNWPRGTAVDMSVETAEKIADLDHVVALKNSTGNWISVVDYIERLADRVRIFASLINRRGIAIMREMGGDGYIDGGGLGAPFAVPFFEALWRGDVEAVRPLADSWWQLTSSLVTNDFGGRYSSPQAQVKCAMHLLGQATSYVRPPLQDMVDAENIALLAEDLRAVGLQPIHTGAVRSS